MTDVLVNLGCGLTAPEGWVNVDRSPNVILSLIPLVKQLMRRAGLLSAAYMSDLADRHHSPRHHAWPSLSRRLRLGLLLACT